MAWIYLQKYLRDFDGGNRQPVVLLHLALELGDFSRVAASARLLEPAQIVPKALGRYAHPRRFVEPLGHGGFRGVAPAVEAVVKTQECDCVKLLRPSSGDEARSGHLYELPR